jgi:hypothetical protein
VLAALAKLARLGGALCGGCGADLPPRAWANESRALALVTWQGRNNRWNDNRRVHWIWGRLGGATLVDFARIRHAHLSGRVWTLFVRVGRASQGIARVLLARHVGLAALVHLTVLTITLLRQIDGPGMMACRALKLRAFAFGARVGARLTLGFSATLFDGVGGVGVWLGQLDPLPSRTSSVGQRGRTSAGWAIIEIITPFVFVIVLFATFID